MKKLAFTLLFVFTFATAMQTRDSLLDVDCFEEAVQSLENFESTIGIRLNDYKAMIYLNEDYAACECLRNGNCYI